jgi:hypothetical protein
MVESRDQQRLFDLRADPIGQQPPSPESIELLSVRLAAEGPRWLESTHLAAR